MKLTKEMRNDFADCVMRKVPARSEWDKEKIIAELKRRLFAAQPKAVQEFSKKYPEQTNWTSVFFDFLTVRDDDGHIRYGRVDCVNGSKVDDIEFGDLIALFNEYKDEQEERKQMRQRIYEQTCCCATLAQLQVVFPNLHGLMPKPVVNVKSLPVPAKTLTDDLVKLGLEIPQ